MFGVTDSKEIQTKYLGFIWYWSVQQADKNFLRLVSGLLASLPFRSRKMFEFAQATSERHTVSYFWLFVGI